HKKKLPFKDSSDPKLKHPLVLVQSFTRLSIDNWVPSLIALTMTSLWGYTSTKVIDQHQKQG
ncbi:hypothetical protein, partial [Peribacillus frigoritolerans]|uniref:hypothetical protein n=1 Tax=Peribacillus castrilensis TaxID=2897690 RepID=UPI003DA23BA2